MCMVQRGQLFVMSLVGGHSLVTGSQLLATAEEVPERSFLACSFLDSFLGFLSCTCTPKLTILTLKSLRKWAVGS